jgi:hypothetical protein
MTKENVALGPSFSIIAVSDILQSKLFAYQHLWHENVSQRGASRYHFHRTTTPRL